MKCLTALLFSLLVATNPSMADDALAKGDAIPDVAVKSRDGESVSLKDLVKQQPTVFIFYRGGWCPYCTEHLAALGGIEKQLREAGYQIVAISADQPSKLAETPGQEDIDYLLYSDNTMKAAEAFGIAFTVPESLVTKYKNEYEIDLEAASGMTHHRLPHPAVFIAGTDGKIEFAHVNENYRVRLEPAKVLEAAGVTP